MASLAIPVLEGDRLRLEQLSLRHSAHTGSIALAERLGFLRSGPGRAGAERFVLEKGAWSGGRPASRNA